MLGFFTDPYPDEILYRAAARYHHRAKNKKVTMTTRDLFGKDNFIYGIYQIFLTMYNNVLHWRYSLTNYDPTKVYLKGHAPNILLFDIDESPFKEIDLRWFN